MQAGLLSEPVTYLTVSSSLSSSGTSVRTYTTSSAWAYVLKSTAINRLFDGSAMAQQTRDIWVDDVGLVDWDNIILEMRGTRYRVVETDPFSRPGYALLRLRRASQTAGEKQL